MAITLARSASSKPRPTRCLYAIASSSISYCASMMPTAPSSVSSVDMSGPVTWTKGTTYSSTPHAAESSGFIKVTAAITKTNERGRLMAWLREG
jgi:hypothetical protein